MKNKTLLQHHKEWCEKGHIPNIGLCNSLPKINKKYKKKLDELFEPSSAKKYELKVQGFDYIYWGSGCGMYESRKCTGYTQLRQNIVLFICAVYNEL